MRVTEYLDAINADLQITYYSNQSGRFTCKIEGGEIKEGVALCGYYGNGKSPHEAAHEYFKKIEGTLLVLNAATQHRREFRVPINLEVNI